MKNEIINDFCAEVEKYNKRVNQVSYFLSPLGINSFNNAKELTAEKIQEILEEARFYAEYLQETMETLDFLKSELTVSQYYCQGKNTVFTIGQYIMQGLSPENAIKARKHDILFNKYVDGIATIEEVAELHVLAEELY